MLLSNNFVVVFFCFVVLKLDNAKSVRLVVPSKLEWESPLLVVGMCGDIRFVGFCSAEFTVELQQTAHCTEIAFMFQKQGFERAMGPVVHSIGQQFH